MWLNLTWVVDCNFNHLSHPGALLIVILKEGNCDGEGGLKVSNCQMSLWNCKIIQGIFSWHLFSYLWKSQCRVIPYKILKNETSVVCTKLHYFYPKGRDDSWPNLEYANGCLRRGCAQSSKQVQSIKTAGNNSGDNVTDSLCFFF